MEEKADDVDHLCGEGDEEGSRQRRPPRPRKTTPRPTTVSTPSVTVPGGNGLTPGGNVQTPTGTIDGDRCNVLTANSIILLQTAKCGLPVLNCFSQQASSPGACN